MINLKLALFNFKKELDFDAQEEIARVAEDHYNIVDNESEKRIINSLNEKLSIHTYDSSVKSLLENLNNDLKNNDLLYNLKDLFKIIESKNQGMIYRQTLNVLLDIINTEDETDVTNKVLNELAMHDWIPEIRTLLHNLHSNPDKKSNLLNGGQISDVYTVVEKVEAGHVVLIDKCWFLMSEEKIEKTLLENHIKDQGKVSSLRQLETALSYAEITKDRVSFKLDENITIGLSTEGGDTFINEDKLEKETSIDNIFSSPIVPLTKKQFFPLIQNINENMDKIIDLDVCKHISNIGNPYLECFVFNYGENMYLYRMDARNDNSFFKYESATELINDLKNELQADLSYFFENRLDEETVQKRQLEDKIREIQVNIDEIDNNQEKVEANIQLLGESEILSKALKMLTKKREDKLNDLVATKKVMHDLTEKLVS